MHDFRKLVGSERDQITTNQEIVLELVCHLEEMYTDLRRVGVPEEEAIMQVAAAGKKLGRVVHRLRWQQEGGWKHWFRSVAIPGISLMLVYEACKALLVDFYWERPFSVRETGTVLICVMLGFLFHGPSVAEPRSGDGPRCLSSHLTRLSAVSWHCW